MNEKGRKLRPAFCLFYVASDGGLAARILAEILVELSFFAVMLFGIGQRVFALKDHGPHFSIFAIKFHPFFRVRLGVGFDGIGRAFGFTNAAINALIGMDHQHIFAFVKAIHRTNLDTIGVFAGDAFIVDDIGHVKIPLALSQALLDLSFMVFKTWLIIFNLSILKGGNRGAHALGWQSDNFNGENLPVGRKNEQIANSDFAR